MLAEIDPSCVEGLGNEMLGIARESKFNYPLPAWFHQSLDTLPQAPMYLPPLLPCPSQPYSYSYISWIHPHIEASINPFDHQSIHSFIQPFIHPSVYPFIHPSINPFMQTYIYSSQFNIFPYSFT